MGVEIQVGGSWKEAADRTPVGVISAFGGTVAPDGWFICDGTAKSRTTYADLYAVIGTAFGAGDGTSTFNLPDLRGRFLRGRDGGAARDPEVGSRLAMSLGGNTADAVGSVQSDAFQGHSHSNPDPPGGYVRAGGGPYALPAGSGYNPVTLNGVRDPSVFAQFGQPRISYETRPINAYVNYIIKF